MEHSLLREGEVVVPGQRWLRQAVDLPGQRWFRFTGEVALTQGEIDYYGSPAVAVATMVDDAAMGILAVEELL